MTDSTLPEDESPTVGQILKAVRLAQGLTLEQVSKSLFINKRQLSYLEEDAEHLACDVYTLGFVKLYAQYLKLNVQDILEKFKEQNADQPRSSQTIFPAPLPGRGMPSIRILGLSLFVLAVIIMGWMGVSNYTVHAPPREIVFDPAPSTQPEPLIKTEVIPVEESHSDLEPPSQPVNLQVTEESWIEVKDKEGNIIVSRMFRPGESFEFKNSENLILRTGNLKGTRLLFGERVFPVADKFEEVGQDIPLDPEKWLE
ncbi:MAG: DUF4115 domain-containing protein [Alphaproteobacteria bacterium]|nr:DUF4115 domain-containing protein [Alphaproteobacteria bacterium]